MLTKSGRRSQKAEAATSFSVNPHRSAEPCRRRTLRHLSAGRFFFGFVRVGAQGITAVAAASLCCAMRPLSPFFFLFRPQNKSITGLSLKNPRLPSFHPRLVQKGSLVLGRPGKLDSSRAESRYSPLYLQCWKIHLYISRPIFKSLCTHGLRASQWQQQYCATPPSSSQDPRNKNNN